MDKRYVFLVVCVAALVTVSCTLVGIPSMRRVETGPTVTKEISVPPPDGEDPVDVEIAMGAGRLRLEPGAESLIEGQIRYNVEELEPTVSTSDSEVRIRQGRLEGIPDIRGDLENEWDLRLGQSRMALTLNVGAAEADVELGGLSLLDLTVNQGASDMSMSFSEANLAEMGTLRVTAGASKMTLSGLANAGADEVVFKGGAGSYTLRFDGERQRDLKVSIDAGLGQLVVIVPEGVPAEVSFDGAATDVDAVHGWQRTNAGYALDGSGPKITFEIKMGIGSLELRNK